MEWDPAAGARWYEIRRCDISGANCTIVGDTRWKNRPGLTATRWCVPWDNPFPTFGASYNYTVRACTDGPLGPLCATALSNPVRYVAAPYMCLDHGVEVACGTNPQSQSSSHALDSDQDGIIDSIDLDDDGDGVPDLTDNCPLMANAGRRDVDGDGVGDACDREPLNPGSTPSDADGDDVSDRLDNCPADYNPLQKDADLDRVGDLCDTCPSAFDPSQADADADGQGDHCDTDDGTILAAWGSRSRLGWDLETEFTSWCVYRGDLEELRRSRTYTQAPGSNPLAARWCELADGALDDPLVPVPGAASFYLVGGRPGAWQTDLGLDGDGLVRPNANPCP